MNAKTAISTAADVSTTVAAWELLDTTGMREERENQSLIFLHAKLIRNFTERISTSSINLVWRCMPGENSPPGASWDLLIVTVVLVRATLLKSNRVMLTQYVPGSTNVRRRRTSHSLDGRTSSHMMVCTSVQLASDTVVQAEMGALTNKMLNLLQCWMSVHV